MKRTSLLLLAFAFGISAFAQHNEEVTIEGSYRPSVNRVTKLPVQPETPQQTFELPSTEVQVLDIEHRFTLELEKLEALRYYGRNAQMPEAAKNFLMAGFGTRISPVFLYRHNSNLTRNLGLGVGIKHYSSWLDIKDYAPSGFMNNAFDLSLTSSKFNNLQIGGRVFYTNDQYHRYGVNLNEQPLTNAEIDKYCAPVVYNTVGGHFGLVSTTTRVGQLSHKMDADYRYLIGWEHAAELDYGLCYTENWWGDRNYPQQLGMDLEARYDYFNNGNRMAVTLNPFFEMKGDFYRLRLGMKADWMNVDPQFTVAPDLGGSLFVLDNKLEFYAGLNGGRRWATLHDLVEENPFLAIEKIGELPATRMKLGFDGGLRTNIAEIVDLHLGVRYRHTDNDPFYVCNFLDTPPYPFQYTPVYNIFSLVYDETQRVSVLLDTRVRLRNGLSSELSFAYHHYDLVQYQRPWHRPTLEGKLKLYYDFNERLSCHASLLYQGGRYAAFVPVNGANGQVFRETPLKDVIDLGLGADYRLNDQLSLFVKANNLLHQKYQLYYNYPVSGIEFFAGMKMTF